MGIEQINRYELTCDACGAEEHVDHPSSAADIKTVQLIFDDGEVINGAELCRNCRYEVCKAMGA